MAVPIKTIVVILVIAMTCIVLFFWTSSQPVECDSIDEVVLSGVLRGFERNGSYWNVALGNITYLFGVFDEAYMRGFVGFNITVFCCYRHTALYDAGHYDVRSCRISEVKGVLILDFYFEGVA